MLLAWALTVPHMPQVLLSEAVVLATRPSKAAECSRAGLRWKGAPASSSQATVSSLAGNESESGGPTSSERRQIQKPCTKHACFTGPRQLPNAVSRQKAGCLVFVPVYSLKHLKAADSLWTPRRL